MDTDGARQVFFAETEELLQEMEEALLSLGVRSDPDGIHRLFRAVHTLKGNSRIFRFHRLEAFSHRIEGLLEAMRAGRVGIDEENLGLLLRAHNHLVALVSDAAEGLETDVVALRRGSELGAELDLTAAAAGSIPDIPFVEEGFPVRWRVEWGIGPDLVRQGPDPLAVMRHLNRQGCIQAPRLLGGLPALAQLEPERCYLSLGFDYLSDLPLAGIRKSFEPCLDHSTLSITRADLGPVPRAPVLEPQPQHAAPTRPPASDAVVRVDAARLDQLVNLVGELVIANAASCVLTGRLGNEQLMACNSTVTRLVEEIRDSALTLRMVPVGECFQRFAPLVGEMALELGKQVELTVSGGDVELDKAVVEKLADQLMHLVRNAVDHGIERPAERVAAGKPAVGRLSLHAFHQSGSVVIAVTDDGRGIDEEKLLARARGAGLVGSDQRPGRPETLRLAFAPGMSTADRISRFSGRGVGLDAVKRKIESLRGSVELDSDPGRGTRVAIRLPLTLSIIDGFRVGVAGLSYVLPLDSVIECIEVSRDPGAGHYINLRGEVLPLLRLRQLFGEPRADAARRENILVVTNGGQKAGLVVDELLGEYQTVIKPLGRLFRKAQGLSGATILGSGEVALILDVPQLIHAATLLHKGRAPTTPPPSQRPREAAPARLSGRTRIEPASAACDGPGPLAI